MKICKKKLSPLGLPIYSMADDNLKFHKVYAWWVPKELTNEHKRLDVCSCLFSCYRKEGD
jgi:hypothetical protein